MNIFIYFFCFTFVPINRSLKSFILLLNKIFIISFDKVTTGTYNSVSLIINTASPTPVDNTHSFFHVKFNLILQLIKGISNNLKKLLKCFNGTTTFTFNLLTPAALPATSVILLNNLILYFKESELSALKSATASSSGGSSRLY